MKPNLLLLVRAQNGFRFSMNTAAAEPAGVGHKHAKASPQSSALSPYCQTILSGGTRSIFSDVKCKLFIAPRSNYLFLR